ncbi:MAG: JAB domain-containing protein [Gammaproteobacteria bacterium]|nr:JAB domain-containing protein [Gammaproteobacteria bacterium]
MSHQQARQLREPRTKILESGAATLSEVELLAVIFQRGAQADSSIRFCDRLLARFGGIRPLLTANSLELSAAFGVGAVRLSILRALPELATRFFEATLPVGEAIRSPADTELFLRARLRDLPHELFCCVYLDNRHRVLRFAEMFRGTIDGTSVYPREVVKEALAVNAAAVILAHNHPSGITEPSQADERITRRLKAALELVDIRLLDHLIIGDGRSTSLASRGLL